jgi:ubiquinone/menaquinone biosynthesis C-methylase UbiE
MAELLSEHTRHYTSGDLDAALAAALREPNHGDTARALETLAELDQFHTGGIAATRALGQRAAISAGDRVLDVGGGLGGPARLLAHEHGCQVTVLDLTEAYCRAGERLTAWAGLDERVRFQHGDALDMPFDDGSFDVAWTQHSSMNIADKPRLYAGIQRVLRPGGRLILFEVVAGSGDPLHFPVPWARGPATSFLLPAEALRQLLSAAGFHALVWEDRSQWALEWLAERQRALAAADGAARPVSLARVFGPEFRTMAQNHGRNLHEGLIRIVEGVLERA